MLRPYEGKVTAVRDERHEEGLYRGHRSIRLKEFDYSTPGFYFVTICAYGRKCTFGDVVQSRARLSVLGEILRGCWVAIPGHFPRVNLHEFVIMPNHLHGILEIVAVGAQHAAPLQDRRHVEVTRSNVKSGSLGAIVRSFKAAVSRRARVELKWEGEIWQRNYFERVLRDAKEIASAVGYIVENPKKWEWDRENPEVNG